MENQTIKDTGNRTKFDTGSHKDLGGNRGNYYLIPLRTLADIILKDNVEKNKPIAYFIANIHQAMVATKVEDKIERLTLAYTTMIKYILGKELTGVVHELAKLYQAGANKYEARDWEKGRPMEVFIDSILRHFFQFLNGETDEDHATAVLWNLLSLINTLERIPSMAYTLKEWVEPTPPPTDDVKSGESRVLNG